MCLVSYSPTKTGFVICSNRDESPLRSHSPLQQVDNSFGSIICPLDQKGGSWIIGSDQNKAVCVLNGAFKNHKRRTDYRMSRGLMMKAYFEFNSTSQFVSKFSFEKIEPFTMVIKDPNGLYEFRWDGRFKYIKRLKDDRLHVWSSCTLYSENMQKQREDAFRNKYEDTVPSAESIFKIQSTTSLGNHEYDFVMNREDRVATISITVIEKRENNMMITHHNLRDNLKESMQLQTRNEN